MHLEAAAVPRAERQRHARLHHSICRDCREEQKPVLLTPIDELLSHEIRLRVGESVLLAELQPLLDGGFDRDAVADGFALEQVFQVLFQLLGIGLGSRPRPGVGSPYSGPTLTSRRPEW